MPINFSKGYPQNSNQPVRAFTNKPNSSLVGREGFNTELIQDDPIAARQYPGDSISGYAKYSPSNYSASASSPSNSRSYSAPTNRYYGTNQGAGATLNKAPVPTASRFDSIMARNSRPIRGEIMSVGPYKTDAYYRNQPGAGGNYGEDGYNDLLRSDVGLDDKGNQIDLQPLNLPDVPKYEAPQVDEQRIAELSRSRFAPILSRLRTALGRTTTANKNIENINARSLANRGALEGYGAGLSSAASSSRNTGRNDYLSQEYAPQVDAARLNYGANVNRYQTNISDMLARRRAALNRYQT